MSSFLQIVGKPVPVGNAPLEGNLLQGTVQAGFPFPAEDLGAQRIDLTQLLIKHSQATYFLKASGHSMTEAGIFDGDILVVDRAVKPRNTHIVVAIVDGEFTVKQLYQRAGRLKLKAANPTYPDITPKEGQTIEVWGVVTATIKMFNV
jgi:DNA polymerase V